TDQRAHQLNVVSERHRQQHRPPPRLKIAADLDELADPPEERPEWNELPERHEVSLGVVLRRDTATGFRQERAIAPFGLVARFLRRLYRDRTKEQRGAGTVHEIFGPRLHRGNP